MSSEVVNRQVVVNIVADDVTKQQDILIARQKKLNEEIAKTGDPKALADLNKQLKATEQQIDRNAKVMKGELLPTYNQLTSAARRYYAEFKKTGDPEVLKKYHEVNNALKQTKTEMAAIEKASGGLTRGGVFSAAFWANLAANGIQRAASAFSNFFSSSIQEALDADEATQRLSSTLDNLGRGDAFDRINRKADEMAQKFRYLDNDDILAVFKKLIDYGKLTEQEMNDLLPVIIDFAANSRISLDESTGVIVKALEGNGKALKQYGLDIKDAGTETDRLNTIMTTLKGKVEGAADAFQNSAKGGIMTARQELNNLKEDIGNAIIPALNSLLSFVVGALKGLKQFAIDIRNSFRGVSAKSIIDGEVSNEVAANAVSKFMDGISKKTKQERIKLITAEISLTEYGLKVLEDEVKAAKFDGKYTGDFKKASEDRRNYLTEKNKLLKDGLALTSDEALGLSDLSDKQVKATKETKKQVDELVDAFQRMLDIRNKINSPLEGKSAFQQRMDAELQFIKSASMFSSRDQVGNDPVAANAAFDRSRLARLELNVLTNRGKQRLQAELALLKEQERQELDAKDKTEAEKLLIEEKYRQLREEAESNHIQKMISLVADYVGQVLNIYDAFAQARTTREDAELAADRRKNDVKQRNLERQLRRGIISQKEYDVQVEQLRQKQDAKEKEYSQRQFRRNQRIAVLQAIINGAQGVVSTFAARPGLADIFTLGTARAIQIALIAATTAAQIASINAQKPQFARGGVLGGRTHAQGGNAIVDGSGRKIAEIERGEGIINRRSMADSRSYTLTGTPSQIASSLNSMNGNGVSWTRPARYMNYGAINRRYYAGGGVFDEGGSYSGNIDQLTRVLERGIQAFVVFNQLETQQDRLNAIRADATMGN